jgi:Zn-dependent M28 family amino/carboxypeptidase
LDTRVHVIAYGAEEVGLVGSAFDAAERDHDEIKAIVNNDGVVRGRTLKAITHGFDVLEDAVSAVADRLDHPIETSPKLGPHSDHWPYVQWGVPGCQMVSVTDYEGRGWGHTEADTLDKVDRRNLAEQAVLLTALTVELADLDVEIPHRDPEEMAAQLEDENLAEGMRIIGDWPY